MPKANEDPEGYAAWKRDNQLALMQITLTLEDTPLDGVVHEPTAKGAWDMLQLLAVESQAQRLDSKR